MGVGVILVSVLVLAIGVYVRLSSAAAGDLLDYYAALPGLPGQPSLDGRPGNGERLKALLAGLGLYSPDMTVYALYRLRERAKMGFSGFEGRYYSLSPSFRADLAPAAELQRLITALACRYAAEGRYTHAAIPDDPETESERRQLVFAAAIGLPVAYVREQVASGQLIEVLGDWRKTFEGYHLYYANRRHASAAFTLFVEALRLRADAPG